MKRWKVLTQIYFEETNVSNHIIDFKEDFNTFQRELSKLRRGRGSSIAVTPTQRSQLNSVWRWLDSVGPVN